MGDAVNINTRKLFWRFWLGRPGWHHRPFAWTYVGYPIGGTLYAGLTLFGWSLLYSTEW